MWPQDTSIGQRLALGFGTVFLLVLMLIARTDMAWTSIGLSLLVLGLGALVSFLVSRSVSGPARALGLASRALARGDFEPALRLASQAGDLPEAQTARDELRVLTAAFGSMAQELLHRERRFATQASLSAGLASSLDAEKVACDAVREIAEHTHCEFGLVYAHDRETHLLKRIGAYSLDGALEAIPVGEGIPGEAAASRRRVLVKDIPADTPFNVHFGFDQVPPRTIVAMPMVCQDQLVGTILLGSLHDLPDEALGFIEIASQQLGVSLQNALYHQQMQMMAEELQEKNELLESQNEEIQAQSEEIQAQNAEILRQNEEIHTQSEKLMAQKKELEEADRHKNEFLAMLAHELRNPLGALSNVVEVARLHGAKDPDCSQVHTILNRQVRHMARLLDDLLDVSRISRGKIELRKEPADLATAVAHAVETVRPLIEARKHEIQISLPPEPVRLEADPTRLEQVLVNLLDNAAKYTEPGGRIWLGAERVGTEAVLWVRDSGVGIPPELLPRVFDLFAQGDRSLDRSQGGLGIGLTMVRSLVEMHGGSVEAHSAGPGQGSELVVRFPALPASSTSEIPAPQRSTGLTPKPAGSEGTQRKLQRILLVDDNVDAAQMLAVFLEMWGHQVRVVHDGPAAIEAAMEDHPEIILLDLGLPGMDGYEVARRLRQQTSLSKTRLVALTGYAQEDARTRSRETGFDHHLIKPIAPADLQHLLATPSKGF